MLLRVFIMALLFGMWFIIGYAIAAWEIGLLLEKFFNEQGTENFIEFMKKERDSDNE